MENDFLSKFTDFKNGASAQTSDVKLRMKQILIKHQVGSTLSHTYLARFHCLQTVSKAAIISPTAG